MLEFAFDTCRRGQTSDGRQVWRGLARPALQPWSFRYRRSGARVLFSVTFGDHRPPPEIKFGIGDIVSVTVFEAAAVGLFIPAEAGGRPGNFVTLPNQPVDNRETPRCLCGLGSAARQDPEEVSKEVVNRIKDRAIEPQVEVALVTQNTSLITVIGEINSSTTASPPGALQRRRW